MTSRALFLIAALLAGCTRTPRDSTDTPPASSATGTDSLCGTVRIVGADPAVMVELELSSGTRERLTGDSARTLRQLSGVGVCVATDRDRTVLGFVVRSLAGEPAIDGVLFERAGTFLVRAANGNETGLTTTPAELRQAVGARVWVVLDNSRRVTSFGVIR